MNKKLYCTINGRKKEVFLGMILPFPKKFHSELEPPYPKDGPVLVNDRLVMKSKLDIAILDTESKFSWEVWVSVSRTTMMQNFDLIKRRPKKGVSKIEALLESSLMFHPNSSGLKIWLSVDEQSTGKYPLFTVITESELRQDQLSGVSMGKVCKWMSDMYSGNIKFGE
jgi:hypothetical protein